jgi:hypothetical protein
MKPRHYLLAIALLVTAWFAFFADKTPGSGIAEPAERGAVSKKSPLSAKNAPATTPAVVPGSGVAGDANKSNADKNKARPEPVIMALRKRAELIGGASAANKGNGFFGSQNWNPPPPPPAKPIAPPPPTAPALPFAFLGKKLEDASWEVYLGRGDNTLIVHEKSEIDGIYRVESIKPPTLTLTYLPLNQMQTMPIGGAD